MIEYDPLGTLILHSKVRLAKDLDVSTDTHCSINSFLLAINVACVRHTRLGKQSHESQIVICTGTRAKSLRRFAQIIAPVQLPKRANQPRRFAKGG